MDFYHAMEYLTGVADNVFLSPIERKRWLDDRYHELKHIVSAAKIILEEMKRFEQEIAEGKPIFLASSSPVKEGRGLLQNQATARTK